MNNYKKIYSSKIPIGSILINNTLNELILLIKVKYTSGSYDPKIFQFIRLFENPHKVSKNELIYLRANTIKDCYKKVI